MRENFDLFNPHGRSNFWQHCLRFSRYPFRYVFADTWIGLKCFIKGHNRGGDNHYCQTCFKYIGKAKTP